MRLIKLIVLVSLLAVGWCYGQKAEILNLDLDEDAIIAGNDSRGFVPSPPLHGANHKNVLVISPPNCTSHEAENARQLVQSLKQKGIPVTLSGEFSLATSNHCDIAFIERLMDQGPPLVFVHGQVKSQPTFSETVTEYQFHQQRTKQPFAKLYQIINRIINR